MGMTVRMTMKDGFVVEGKVNKVVPEHQTLLLQNGKTICRDGQTDIDF